MISRHRANRNPPQSKPKTYHFDMRTETLRDKIATTVQLCQGCTLTSDHVAGHILQIDTLKEALEVLHIMAERLSKEGHTERSAQALKRYDEIQFKL